MGSPGARGELFVPLSCSEMSQRHQCASGGLVVHSGLSAAGIKIAVWSRLWRRLIWSRGLVLYSPLAVNRLGHGHVSRPWAVLFCEPVWPGGIIRRSAGKRKDAGSTPRFESSHLSLQKS